MKKTSKKVKKNRDSLANVHKHGSDRRMNHRLLPNTLHSLQRQWILSFVLVIVGIVMLTNVSAWAAPVLAPLHQTVPVPTATPTPTPVPTVTPAPTSTPEAESTDDPAAEPEEPVDFDEDGSNDDDGSFFGEDTNDEPPTDEVETDENSVSGDDSNDESTVDTIDSSSSGEGNTESAAEVDGADATTTTIASTGLMANVAVIVLNIREQPNLESAVLGTVFQDDLLEVLGRNGEWWMVCCAIGSDQPAWVNPDFLDADFDIEQADELLPMIGQWVADTADASSTGSVQAAESAAELELTMSLNPRYVWQNLPFDLEFVVRNVGDSAVTDVVLRDELLADLEFIAAEVSNDGQVVKEQLDNGNALVSVSWANLAANAEVTVAYTLRVIGDLENGYVIDNLSVVDSAETSSTTAGISIGLPPAELPIFK